MPAPSASVLERFDLESSTCYQFFSNQVLPVVFKSQISALRVSGQRVLEQTYQRLSSTVGSVQPKIVSTDGRLSLKVVFHGKVVFHQRLSSTKGHHPPTLNRSGLNFFWKNEVNKTNTRTKSYIEAACCLKHIGMMLKFHTSYIL